MVNMLWMSLSAMTRFFTFQIGHDQIFTCMRLASMVMVLVSWAWGWTVLINGIVRLISLSLPLSWQLLYKPQSSQQFQVLHSRCFTCVDVYLNIPMLHVLGGNEIIKLVYIFFKPGEETYVNALHEYTNKNAHAWNMNKCTKSKEHIWWQQVSGV